MATQIGEAVIKLTFDGKDIQASLNKIDSTAKTSGEKTGKVFGDALTVAAGNLISKGISKVMSKISGSLDTAISRVDTLKNANKVFTAMGYSASATAQSMDTLNTYLDGLPTSMTTAVQSVQSLAASFGGIEKGTQTFIDMNNAGLAFGATTEQIEGAIMQLGQLSMDGPLDAQTWNSLRNNGFSPVFAAMAQEAGITVGELKEQFGGNGTKTVEDFLNELHKLSTQGGAEMESLESLARKNTDGIGTALENVQNRIGKAMAKVIDHIGSEKIAGVINEISSHFTDLADGIITAIDFIANHWNVISPILATLGTVAGTITAINLALKAYHKIQTAVNAVQKIFSKTLGGISSGISKVTGVFKQSPIGGAAEKVGGIFQKLSSTIQSVFQNLGSILKSAVQAVMEPLKELLNGLAEALRGFFTTMADPAILLGAAMFAAAAASIAAAIYLIGTAVGAIMPVLIDLFNNVIMPIAEFIADTVLNLIDVLTNAIVTLTQNALIPLGEFLVSSFIAIIESVAGVIVNLTQNAVVPLINTLSGAFTNVINAIANLITGVLNAALQGIAEIVKAVGDGFLKMGEAIKLALEGVQGVLSVFADLIKSIASAAVAIVAMVTGHSINYGSGYAHLFAEGGKVEGPGTSTSDSIPAFLSDGEYVIKAKSAKAIGYNVLDMLNDNPRDWSTGLYADASGNFSESTIGGKIVNVYMTNEINNRLDAEEIGQIMMESIRRAA